MALKLVLFFNTVLYYNATSKHKPTLNELYSLLPVRAMKVNTVAFITIVYSVRTFNILSHVK
jgi:hypothetical protein